VSTVFRRASRLMRAYRERILSLVLLPAFVLGTLPHPACICADGHREPICQASLHSAANRGILATACCGCSACKQRSSNQVRNCCRGQEQATNPPEHKPGLAARDCGCCHPYLESGAPAVAASKVTIRSWSELSAVVNPATPPLPVRTTRLTFRRISWSGPPPVDAAVVFQRLTI
jgi:hypothetical protein